MLSHEKPRKFRKKIKMQLRGSLPFKSDYVKPLTIDLLIKILAFFEGDYKFLNNLRLVSAQFNKAALATVDAVSSRFVAGCSGRQLSTNEAMVIDKQIEFLLLLSSQWDNFIKLLNDNDVNKIGNGFILKMLTRLHHCSCKTKEHAQNLYIRMLSFAAISSDCGKMVRLVVEEIIKNQQFITEGFFLEILKLCFNRKDLLLAKNAMLNFLNLQKSLDIVAAQCFIDEWLVVYLKKTFLRNRNYLNMFWVDEILKIITQRSFVHKKLTITNLADVTLSLAINRGHVELFENSLKIKKLEPEQKEELFCQMSAKPGFLYLVKRLKNIDLKISSLILCLRNFVLQKYKVHDQHQERYLANIIDLTITFHARATNNFFMKTIGSDCCLNSEEDCNVELETETIILANHFIKVHGDILSLKEHALLVAIQNKLEFLIEKLANPKLTVNFLRVYAKHILAITNLRDREPEEMFIKIIRSDREALNDKINLFQVIDVFFDCNVSLGLHMNYLNIWQVLLLVAIKNGYCAVVDELLSLQADVKDHNRTINELGLEQNQSILMYLPVIILELQAISTNCSRQYQRETECIVKLIQAVTELSINAYQEILSFRMLVPAFNHYLSWGKMKPEVANSFFNLTISNNTYFLTAGQLLLFLAASEINIEYTSKFLKEGVSLLTLSNIPLIVVLTQAVAVRYEFLPWFFEEIFLQMLHSSENQGINFNIYHWYITQDRLLNQSCPLEFKMYLLVLCIQYEFHEIFKKIFYNYLSDEQRQCYSQSLISILFNNKFFNMRGKKNRMFFKKNGLNPCLQGLFFVAPNKISGDISNSNFSLLTGKSSQNVYQDEIKYFIYKDKKIYGKVKSIEGSGWCALRAAGFANPISTIERLSESIQIRPGIQLINNAVIVEMIRDSIYNNYQAMFSLGQQSKCFAGMDAEGFLISAKLNDMYMKIQHQDPETLQQIPEERNKFYSYLETPEVQQAYLSYILEHKHADYNLILACLEVENKNRKVVLLVGSYDEERCDPMTNLSETEINFEDLDITLVLYTPHQNHLLSSYDRFFVQQVTLLDMYHNNHHQGCKLKNII